MLLEVVGGGVYRFFPLEGYRDEGDLDRRRPSCCWPDLDLAFYARLFRALANGGRT